MPFTSLKKKSSTSLLCLVGTHGATRRMLSPYYIIYIGVYVYSVIYAYAYKKGVYSIYCRHAIHIVYMCKYRYNVYYSSTTTVVYSVTYTDLYNIHVY